MMLINVFDLSLEQCGQWPWRVKTSILFAVHIAVIILGYWLSISDNLTKYDYLRAQEKILRADFESKQLQVVNRVEYRMQLRTMQERFALWLKRFPAKNELPDLLAEISRTGSTSGLKFELFAPQQEINHDFYVEIPIKISVVGSYFQLADFLSRVAQMKSIVTLHEFSVQRLSSPDELMMDITAKTYRYRLS